jgi:peptide/nickel transport system substrate-binding protein
VDYGIRVNLSYEDDPEIGDLLRTPDFRRALSLGIDRPQVNEAFFLGTGTESSFVPSPSNKYFPGAEWTTKWATLDVTKANQLLDGLGLKKSADGARQRRDGKGPLRLDYTAPTPSFADWVAMGEMIRGHWQKIGIELTVQAVSGTLALERALANQMQLSGHQVGSEDLFLAPEMAFPSTLAYAGLNGILYAQWFQSNGTRGKEPYRELRDLMDLWRKGFAAAEADRIRIGKEWWQRAADQCLQIGVVSRSLSQYGIHLVKNGLGNVPERTLSSTVIGTPLNALPMTFYWK